MQNEIAYKQKQTVNTDSNKFSAGSANKRRLPAWVSQRPNAGCGDVEEAFSFASPTYH